MADTRQERQANIAVTSTELVWPGKCRILVKVIDIFGNDTTQLAEVMV